MVTEEGIRGHRLVTHGDVAHFAVFGTGRAQAKGLPAGASAINWPGTTGRTEDGWNRLQAAALATAAFPLGLPARPFSNDLRVYEARSWSRPAGISIDEPPP